MPYQFEAYDVLQCKRKGEWLDFSTLRTEDDGKRAEQLVLGGVWDGEPLAFRIRRGFNNVVFEVVPLRYRWNPVEGHWEYFGAFGWRGCTDTPLDEEQGREFLKRQHIERSAAVAPYRPDPDCNYIVFEEYDSPVEA